ncbi:MAG TPA: hypothetical protein ENN60_00215 [archaeon]|nr:hypothetical protein [archaeon]
MADTFRVVLTGGPGSGKTTVLYHLRRMCKQKDVDACFI